MASDDYLVYLQDMHMQSERRKIAAMAMQGLLTNGNLELKISEKRVDKTTVNIAIASVAYADALIAELDKHKES